MTYNLITIPAGFSTKESYIKWMATVEVDNGFGAPGATFHRQTPPLTGKVKEGVQPHSKGGVVKLNINVNYRLFKPIDLPMNQQMPEEVESDMFWFGCEWPYNYSKDQLVFGPSEKYTMPVSRGFKLLQGLCDEVQSKDQVGAVRPFAYAVPQLSLKSAPGEASTVSFQLPIIGGPSYTPPGIPPTPDGGFRVGGVWIELDVVAPTFTPIVEIKLKPLYFIQPFYTDSKNDDDIKKNEDLVALMNWVSAVKASELYPVIKDGSLPIHIEGHASKTGNDLLDFDLSQKRRQNVQRRFQGMIDANPVIIVNDRGKSDASQVDLPPNQRNEGYLKDRYVKIEIREDEAKRALQVYYQKGGR